MYYVFIKIDEKIIQVKNHTSCVRQIMYALLLSKRILINTYNV